MASWTHRSRAAACASLILVVGGACGEALEGDVEGSAFNIERAREERDMRVAPDADPISAREVQAELDALEPGEHLGVPDFQKLLMAFQSARTSLALQWLTTEAWSIAVGRPGRSSYAFLRRLAREHDRAQVQPGFTMGVPTDAECHVGFDTPEVLAALPDQAQATFAVDPFYFEPCRTGFIRVEPLKYTHYHLSYEDPTIQCFDDEGRMGRGEFGNCVAIEDPTLEPRLLGSHHGSEIIRIWYSSGGGLNLPLPFTVRSIANVSSQPIKFRYRKTTGEWFQWNSLAGHTLWILPGVTDVDEVLITHADTAIDCGGEDWEASVPGGCPFSNFPFFFDDVAIEPATPVNP
jgi:hypothetical protein